MSLQTPGVDSETVAEFAGGLRGDLLQPEDDGYDEARTVWNGMIDREPSIIVQATGTADVVAAVDFARENDIEDLIVTDNRAVIRYRFSGTHEGQIMDVPATGRHLETVGIVIFRIEDGQLVEEWAMDDIFGLLKQLGELDETTPSVI